MARTVIIVEDEDNAAPLEIALNSLPGIVIHLCPNEREALVLLSSTCFEIAAVITDLNLPHVDGFALVREIRLQEQYRTLPIVVISGNGDPETPALVRQAGANAFFSKPYSPSEIRHMLKKLLYAH